MPQEQAQDGKAAVIMLTSEQAQALETQIAAQALTVKQSCDYFGTGVYGADIELMGANRRTYATPEQLRQLSHKHRATVKGLDPWEASESMAFLYSDYTKEKLTIPDPVTCEFCGKTLEYIAIVRKSKNALYEWEVERWSDIPMRCDCKQAQDKWAAQEAEENRLKEEAEREREEKARRERIEKAMAQSGMKKRFLARTFANFQTDTPGRAKANRVAKEYADNFQAHSANGDGLYIEGTFGTGKTHLAAAIAIQLMEQGHNVIFKTADDLLRDIKATFDESGREEQKVLDKLKGCELLVIDDIGKEQATDWSTAQLYAIINDRYECQKPLIITTNFNENDLIAIESPKGVGTHRIMAILSRLHETCRLMTMNWQDWRGTG